MKTSAIIRIVCGVMVATLLTSLLFWAIEPGTSRLPHINFSFGNTYSYQDADKYTIGGGQASMEKINEIKINWISGNVIVEEYDGNEIIFDETSNKDLDEDNRMRYLIEDGTLKIQFFKSRFFSMFKQMNLQKVLTVKIPRNMTGMLRELNIDTITELNVSGINADKADLTSISGKINVSNSKFTELKTSNVSGTTELNGISGDYAKIDSTSGKINAVAFFYNEVKTNNVSGSTNLDGRFKEIQSDTVSGSIKYISEICPDRIKADSVSGSINIEIPDNIGFVCDVDTVSGDVDTDFEASVKKNMINYKNGTADFNLNTVSGSVFVKKNTSVTQQETQPTTQETTQETLPPVTQVTEPGTSPEQ